jgi:integrase/recombinase XerD
VETAPVEKWVTWLRDVRRVRGATLDAYSRTLGAFVDWNPNEFAWSDVDAPMIEAFMGRERRGGIIGQPATQDRDRIALSGFMQWMVNNNALPINPVVNVGVPKVRNRHPKAISDLLWSQLWSSKLSDDDRAWLGLGCFAGMRRREIVSVAPHQFDTGRGMILFLERKGGDEEAVEYEQGARIIADGLPQVLPDVDGWLATIALSVARRATERCLVTCDTPASETGRLRASFTDPRLPEPGQLNKQLCRLLVAAGLPHNAFSPHALRHTCATNLLRCGVPIEVVADYLGHADISTTMRYVKSSGRLQEWSKRLKQ